MYVKFDKPFYHGTVSEIIRVDVNRGRDRKDFGKGFYIAASRKQAVGMMHKKYREAVRRNRNREKQIFRSIFMKFFWMRDMPVRLILKFLNMQMKSGLILS